MIFGHFGMIPLIKTYKNPKKPMDFQASVCRTFVRGLIQPEINWNKKWVSIVQSMGIHLTKKWGI